MAARMGKSGGAKRLNLNNFLNPRGSQRQIVKKNKKKKRKRMKKAGHAKRIEERDPVQFLQDGDILGVGAVSEQGTTVDGPLQVHDLSS